MHSPRHIEPHRHARRTPLRHAVVRCGIALMMTGAAWAQEDDLPLPRWSPDELRAFGELGGAPSLTETLLPDVPDYMQDGSDPLRSGPRLEDLPATLTGDITPRLSVEDLRLFLPDTQTLPAMEVRSAMAAGVLSHGVLKEVTREFILAANEALRSEYLIDPDVIVPEMAHLQMLRFLEFHAHDARIKLYVLVIPKDSRLPAKPELDGIASGSLVKSEACLLVYSIGEPWRARLFVSKSVFEHTSATFLAETTQACAKAAMQSSAAADQLQNFAMELSTRLFWLQKALGKESTANVAQSLAEVAPPDAGSHTAGVAMPSVTPVATDDAWTAVLWTLACVFMAAVGGLGFLHWQKRRKRRVQTRVWILPEIETAPRLGGAFTGGGGAVVR